ncbi:TetR/AcrR family transcriptional regulator [Phytomonospora sp. NPDC050363]|uniref:TetR/AcrR family transcriptional regulator n=1 Tax=Phytomonospora sp. NPDC050363 TaxID=3155642 RepID=UPI0033FE62EB
MTDGRKARGERTRAAVLDTAVALASVDGLDGITLGQLAASHGVSKSGLFAHWRDKEDLQLAVVDRAREQWWNEVVRPAFAAPRGIRQLWALHEQRMGFYERRVLPGGCFFATAVHEFDDHPGPVRDRIFDALRHWLRLLRNTVKEAVAMGELRDETDPKQLAFEMQAIGVAVVTHSRLLASASAYQYSRQAILDRLRALAIDPSLLDEPKRNGEPT